MKIYSQTEVRDRVNQIITQTLTLQCQQAATIDPAYSQLWQAMADLILAGGKRLRPYLTCTSYVANGGAEADDIFTVAAAQELLHFALLIHDDIIDRDTIRYGRPNVMGQYQQLYAAAEADAAHFASGAALLAGDLALTQAYDLVGQTGFTPEQKLAANYYLGRSMYEVAGGELLDMEAVFVANPADYFVIARYKTASYSFVNPLLTGAALANASADTKRNLTDYGANLGIAYQLADDLLGLYGDEATIGKPVVSDLREGKQTYLFGLIRKLSNEVDRRYFDQVWGNSMVSMTDVERVQQLGITSGAKVRVERRMEEYAALAHQALDQLGLDRELLEPLVELLQQSIKRKF